MKILFVDIWDKTLARVEYVKNIYPDSEIILFHYGSITEKAKKLDYTHNSIRVVDVSSIKGICPLTNLIKDFQPDFLFLFTDHHITDQLAISTARRLNITTIYFQQGLKFEDKISSLKLNPVKRGKIDAITKVNSYLKYISLLLRSEFRNLRANSLLETVKYLINLKIGDQYFNRNLRSCDHYFVYGQVNKNQILKIRKVDKKDIYITGYFDIQKLEPSIKNKTKSFSSLSTVLCIMQPFHEDFDFDKNKIVKQLNILADEFEKKGFEFFIKLHPRQNAIEYNKLFSKNITIIKEISDKYDLFIGNYSTALLYPVYYKKPIYIIPIYPLSPINSSNPIKFPINFVELGVAKYLININDINQDEKIDEEKFNLFFKNYIGTVDTMNALKDAITDISK